MQPSENEISNPLHSASSDESIAQGKGHVKRDTEIRLGTLLRKINEEDEHFTKYIPRAFREGTFKLNKNSHFYRMLNKLTSSGGKMKKFLKYVFSKEFLADHTVLYGNYMFNEVRRNFQRVMGPYFDVFTPLFNDFDEKKAKYVTNKLEKATEVAQLYKKYGFTPGSVEDAAVQMLGEGKVYFDFDYKGHKDLFKAMGFSERFVTDNKAEIDFTFEMCCEIFGEEKALQIRECTEFIRNQYEDYLTKINHVISFIYPGQEQRLIKKRKNYFHHFREIKDNLASFAQILADDTQISPELVGKTDRTRPNSSFEGPYQDRKGEMTEYSAYLGYVDYIEHAEYTININPFIKEFRDMRNFFAYAKTLEGTDNLNSFLNYLDKFANHLAKKSLGFDRIFTDIWGRDGRTLLKGITWLNTRKMKNSVMYNFATGVKQIMNLPNGFYYLQKPTLLLKSSAGLLRACTSDPVLMEHYESLMKQSNFLKERYYDRDMPFRKKGFSEVDGSILTIGDEFSVRSIWLAAHHEGMENEEITNPVIYADDITRRCCAGRGVGDMPLILKQSVSNLVLPFLTEPINNVGVQRDFILNTVKSKDGIDHEFSDVNSYLYHFNKKSFKDKAKSKIFAGVLITLFLHMANNIIEELLGVRATTDFTNDIFEGCEEAIKDNNGKFELSCLDDCIFNSVKNMGEDFIDHRALGVFYNLILSMFSDDPITSSNEIFGQTPVLSALTDVGSKIDDKDFIGAGLDLTTSFLMPYGGNQLKKSINGTIDFIQGGNYKNTPTKQLQNSILRKFDRGGAIRGEKQYEIEKTPGNFARGLLFGQNSFPETQEYYDSKAEDKKTDSRQARIEKDAFNKFREGAKGAEYDEFWRVWDNSDNDGALPYRYISPTLEFSSDSGKSYSIELSPEQHKMYQERMNSEAKDAFSDIIKSKEYKNASDVEKAKLLSAAGNNIYDKILSDMKTDAINNIFIEDYTEKYGEDEIIKAFKRSGNRAEFVPHSEIKPGREVTLNGKKTKFDLSQDEIEKYTELADERIREEFKKIISDPIWYTKNNEQRAKSLSKAKKRAVDTISEYIKLDYVYKDAIAEFDAAHGEDNPVRKAYEYSHDASVYPYWNLNTKIEFSDKNKSYEYELSEEELDSLTEYYNRKLIKGYVENAISGGYTKGKSNEALYKFFTDYKKKMQKFYNKQLRNYAKSKLGFSESTFE